MSDSLNIGLIQSDLYWENTEANLAMFEEKVWSFEKEVDVVVLPEMFSTGFSMDARQLAEPMNSKTFRWMKQIAAQKDCLVVGSYIIREKEVFRNRLFTVFPDGQHEIYDKRHLFSLAGESDSYTAGESRLIVEWKGWKIFPMICYDLRFPVWSRSTGYEYDLLIYIANWPSKRVNAWDTLLQARAIENQSYAVGVNRTGIDGYKVDYNGHSSVVDYVGEQLLNPIEEQHVSVVSIEKAPMLKFRDKFNFQKESDHFTIH